LALYTDKHGIFRINHQGAKLGEETHVQRALRELDVELICANSPQAKGRVERANRTLQDRLVKELRLYSVSTIAEANRLLPQFLEFFNNRFSLAPRETHNAHRPADTVALATMLTKQYERVLTSNLTFQIDDRIYAVDPSPLHRFKAKSRVAVAVPRSSEPFILHNHQRINARLVGERQRTAIVVESKDLNAHLDRRIPNPKKGTVPAKSHPWRKGYDPVKIAEYLAARGQS
jgi:hypothetical protein